MVSKMEEIIDWDDVDLLQKTISQSKSRADALRKLGYSDKGPISRRKLNKAIKKHNLDISSFTCRTDRWDILPKVIKDCQSMADVLRAVGLRDHGDNHKTAKRYIKEMGLSTDHFVKNKGGSDSVCTDEEIFCKNSKVARHTVKRRIKSKKLLEYKCAKCDNEGRWMNKPLSLHLEHKNGVSNDNRLENLEYLCPNCHSQTSTYGGKNRGVV